MSSRANKDWASKYLIDPLNDPEPAAETGPGTRYGSTFADRPIDEQAINKSSQEKKSASVNVQEAEDAYPSPPSSASPLQGEFAHRSKNNLPEQSKAPSSQRQRSASIGNSAGNSTISAHARPSTESRNNPFRNSPSPSTAAKTQLNEGTAIGGRRRGASLGSRFAGDKSNQPLDIIRRDSLRAHRAPHLRKAQHHGLDTIDKLDGGLGGAYHHEGAYDAVSRARNPDDDKFHSPVAALARTNAEAIRATPRERVIDSIRHHRPLDGTAAIPPGQEHPTGEVLSYKEGQNMMIESGGDYKRWTTLDYHENDLKGKGKPTTDLEDGTDRRLSSDQPSEQFEMTSRPAHSKSTSRSIFGHRHSSSHDSALQGTRNSTGRASLGHQGDSHAHGSGLGRFGSIRRRRAVDSSDA